MHLRWQKFFFTIGNMHETSSQHVEKLIKLAESLQSLVAAMARPDPVIKPEIAERVAYLTDPSRKICLRCTEQKEGRYTRGQCVNCYNKTIAEIDANPSLETTLIELGRLVPAKRGGRPGSVPALDANLLRPITEVTQEDPPAAKTTRGQQLVDAAVKRKSAKKPNGT